jgi:Sec-independent protein translocase protein TatA
MKTFKNEQEIKEHVGLLKNFYMGFYSYLVVVGATFLIWMMSGAGYFWPIWIIVIWGAALLFKASKLEVIDGAYYRLLHSVRDRLPFLRPEWENQKFAEFKKSSLTGSVDFGSKVTAAPSTKKKAAAVKKAPVKKTSAVKKTGVKKAPAKKTAAEKKPTTEN